MVKLQFWSSTSQGRQRNQSLEMFFDGKAIRESTMPCNDAIEVSELNDFTFNESFPTSQWQMLSKLLSYEAVIRVDVTCCYCQLPTAAEVCFASCPLVLVAFGHWCFAWEWNVFGSTICPLQDPQDPFFLGEGAVKSLVVVLCWDEIMLCGRRSLFSLYYTARIHVKTIFTNQNI